MEMYTGPEHGPTETYMMPGTSSNSHITLLPPPEETNYMGNEVAPEVVYDQGLYYPAANYYGYYCTGVEAPSEWDDHHRSFGLDGQELQYSGLQTESFPYVYYPPSYGYAQSSYNPYNPYIPGAVIGLDGPSFIGTQQYFTNPSYQSPVSTPAYIPVVVHPSSDVPNSSGGRPLYGTAVSRQSNAGAKYSHPLSSSNVGTTSQRAASGIPTSESSQSSNQVETTTKSSEGSLANASSSKQASSLGTMTSGSVTQMAQSQGRNSSGLMQATDHFPHGRVSSVHNPLKVTSPSGNVIPNFASNIRGWATVRPRFHYTGVVNNGNGSPDILGEQNRGPRTNRSKGQWTPATSDGSHMTKAGARNAQGTIIIYADQYNRDDFLVDYPDAKFFVIKSYSEDDVHKSVKYNVWSSTPNGNKRLDTAYEDAQKISAGKPRNCPIFLFFSVNASGQFCGVAEMIGPVDFHKDMDFWQQDKWTGSFPVKWHIIKDVPNTSFRHIILENNENKPVTNSRDTQEVTYIPGMNMLKIFRSSPLKTSILDDFMFYEERQRVMQEEKSRYLGRNYNTYLAAIVPANQPNDTSTADLANQPPEDGELPSGKTGQPPKADAKQEVDQPLKSAGVSAKPKCHKSSGDEQQVTSEPHAIKPSDDEKDSKPDPEGDDGNVTSTIVKMELLSIDSKEGGANSSEAMAAESSTRTDVVTVGSMQIKVNGVGEPSSKIITIGSIPIDPNVSKLNIQGDV